MPDLLPAAVSGAANMARTMLAFLPPHLRAALLILLWLAASSLGGWLGYQGFVKIGLETVAAAGNNRLDLFQEMRQAALLAKVSTGDAAALPARTALRMATLDGARALGLDTTIGSIVPGKKADLCAVTLESTCLQPCFDPVSHLVFVCGREHVSHVWVEGELRAMGGNALLQRSNSELLHLAALWHHKLVSK